MILTPTHRRILRAMARLNGTAMALKSHESEATELEKMGLVIRIDKGYNAPTWRLSDKGCDALKK